MVMEDLDRGITGISARGMYSGEDKLMLFCVVGKKGTGTSEREN